MVCVFLRMCLCYVALLFWRMLEALRKARRICWVNNINGSWAGTMSCSLLVTVASTALTH